MRAHLYRMGVRVRTVYLCMEVIGCPTVCRHCWAQGVPYGAMPLADIVWALERAHRFCDDQGLSFDAYPMHEMAAHPDARRLFRLLDPRGGHGAVSTSAAVMASDQYDTACVRLNHPPGS